MTFPDAAPVRLQLRLFVAGQAPNSLLALSNLRAICEQHFPSDHEIEVVDLLVAPQRALADGIIVTPTLVRLAPLPVQRIVGNLSDACQVLLALAFVGSARSAGGADR